ncbi:hypothetical protein [Myroides sp. DW712]|uniref:hypothetical protein n=1 Tax=Myroides sp. DW712 TaxID=3389800 RepID=UPI00397E32E5
MKPYYILFTLFCGSVLYAQDIPQTQPETDSIAKPVKGNLIKLNPIPLAWGTGSITYERKVGGRLVAGTTVNYRPTSGAPFKSTLQKIFESDDSDGDATFEIDKLKYSNFSFAPEIKLYLGKKGAFQGFYIAAFAKIETTKINYDYQFDELIMLGEDPNLPLTGKIKAFSGGLYFGVQWYLGKNIYLDWQIIGGNYGSANIDIVANKNLSVEEQEALQEFAEDLKDSFDKIDYEVNDKGIKLKGKMPWAGLRTGLSIAYRF